MKDTKEVIRKTGKKKSAFKNIKDDKNDIDVVEPFGFELYLHRKKEKIMMK